MTFFKVALGAMLLVFVAVFVLSVCCALVNETADTDFGHGGFAEWLTEVIEETIEEASK